LIRLFSLYVSFTTSLPWADIVSLCLMSHYNQGCSLGLNVSVSRRSFQTSQSRGNVGRSQSRSRLGLKIKCLGLVSVLYHRVSFTSQYAQLFALLQNCTFIVLNAGRLYCFLIHKLRSRLHPCCIHLQLQCSTQFKKSFTLTLLMQNL